MNTKHGLPMANNRRQEISKLEPAAESKQSATSDNKHQGTMEKQKLEEKKNQGTIEKQKFEKIKNFGSVIQLAGKIIDIYKIREIANAHVLEMDAEMKKMTIEASTYVEKLDAETSQFVVKGQIAASIIVAISDLINQSNDLDANGKLEAIKSMANMVKSILEK